MLSTLRLRLPIAIVGLGLASSTVMGWIGWSGAERALETAAFERLSLAAESRRTALELVAERLRVDTRNIAGHKFVLDNISDLTDTLTKAPDTLPKNIEFFTSAPPAERADNDGSMSGTMYGLRHSKVHPIVMSTLTQASYDDVLLLDDRDRRLDVTDHRCGRDIHASAVCLEGRKRIAHRPILNREVRH